MAVRAWDTQPEQDPTKCSVVNCKGKCEDVRLIEDRIRWGAAVRRGFGTGFSGRPYPACKACRGRIRIGGLVWKYHQPD